MKHFKNTCLLIAGLLVGPICWAQVAVVAGAQSAASPLSAEQVSALFLGKSDQLPGVGAVSLLDQPESAPVREQFYSKATGKSAAQVKAAWARLVFSGKATLPKELASSAEVKKALASNPKALGYIEKSAVDASVKVLLSLD